jgi:hypothetical protein
MNPTYLKALLGTLISPEPVSQPVYIQITNEFPINLVLYSVSTDGSLTLNTGIAASIQPDVVNENTLLVPSQYYIVASAHSGAFMFPLMFSELSAGDIITIGPSLLLEPNDIGPFPVPNADQPIPPDSWAVVVGVGLAPNGNPMAREQYWQRSQESYCLAPGEVRTASVTSMQGLQDTTTDETTVQSSVSTSVSAGWGAISASVSASLSQSSSHSHTVSIQSQLTRYSSDTLMNMDNYTKYFLKWDMVDRTIVYALPAQIGAAMNLLSTIIHKTEPTLVGGPYNPADLPSNSVHVPAGLLGS